MYGKASDCEINHVLRPHRPHHVSGRLKAWSPVAFHYGDDVDIRSRITRSILVNIPIIASAMDTVTEASMAIAMAREGGIGIIHRNMGIERQVTEVDKVKKSESGMIVDPITMRPTQKIREAL